MKATRVFQLTALALVVVAAVQVGYWLFDQETKAMEKVHDERALYSRQVDAAQAMLESASFIGSARQKRRMPFRASTRNASAMNSGCAVSHEMKRNPVDRNCNGVFGVAAAMSRMRSHGSSFL